MDNCVSIHVLMHFMSYLIVTIIFLSISLVANIAPPHLCAVGGAIVVFVSQYFLEPHGLTMEKVSNNCAQCYSKIYIDLKYFLH